MCDCVIPREVFGERISAEWIGQDGRVAHPASPLGAGGAGNFRSAGPLNHAAEAEFLPHPDSPAAPMLAPEDKAEAEQLQAQAVAAKPPPKVSKQETETVGKLEIVIDIDGSGGTTDTGAVTTPVLTHSGSMRTLKTPDNTRIQDFKNEKKFKVVIQTIYHRGTPEMNSKYGRGKTPGDLAVGNVTLGFHESCHRDDLRSFFKAATQPVFGGAKNMLVADFDKEFASYLKAWQDLVPQAEKDSLDKTDEVDPKKSNYKP